MRLSLRLEMQSERDGMCECSDLGCQCRGRCVEDATTDVVRSGITFGHCEPCAESALVRGAIKLGRVA